MTAIDGPSAVPMAPPPAEAAPRAGAAATVTAADERRPATEGPLEAALLACVGLTLAAFAALAPDVTDPGSAAAAVSTVGRPAWIGVGVAVALMGTPALRRRPPAGWARALRACLALTALGAGATTLPLTPVAVIGVLAVCAGYPLALQPRAAARVGAVAAAACWLPAAAHLLADGGLGSAADPARRDGALLLAVTGLVCLVVAAVSSSGGRALRTHAGLAAEHAVRARRKGDELARATTLDPHTGLPNRTELLRFTARALARADAVGGAVALLVVELDRLDRVADGLGPQAAREALAQAARRLRAARPAEDVVARIGPAVFAVLVEGVGPEGCDGTARRTVGIMEEPLDAQGRDVVLPCTIGASLAVPGGRGLETPEDLLRAAEEAREAARRSPYARWATFDVAMRAHSVSQAGMELDLRDVLRRGEIELAFQPVWPLAGVLRQMLGGAADPGPPLPGQDVVVEALARWTRPDGSAVPPARFVALAEEMGLGPTLGFQVLNRALSALSAWRAQGVQVARVAVNLSRSQVEDPDFASVVAARLAAHHLDGDSLAVDVRVADLVDPDRVAGTLNKLQSLGVQVTIDDLGVAGAGLAALRRIPASAVKLDRVLTAELGGDDDRLVRAVAGACRDLGLTVVAEGVETVGQLRGAHQLGLHAVQGYLLARPVDARDLPVVLSLPPTSTGRLPVPPGLPAAGTPAPEVPSTPAVDRPAAVASPRPSTTTVGVPAPALRTPRASATSGK